MCWFPGPKPGDERGNAEAAHVAAIRGYPRNCKRRARVEGHWATGKAGRTLSNDPRARRPASTVTQPVDGASIRSGLSQR